MTSITLTKFETYTSVNVRTTTSSSDDSLDEDTKLIETSETRD